MKKPLCSPSTTRYWLLALTLLGTATAAQAQNNVGVGTTTPDASAVLDASSTTQGMLVPRMNSTQRAAVKDPATNRPATGLLVYQTDAPAGFYFYNGTAWTALSGSGTGAQGPAGPQGPQGPQGATGQPGPQGQPGQAGQTGQQGQTGQTGPQGPQGAQGQQGPAGQPGQQGSQGQPGQQGSPGPQGVAGPAGQGVPTGGTAGQVLSKNSGTDYDIQWATPAAGSNVTAQLYATSTNPQTRPVYAFNRYTFGFDRVVSVVSATAWTGNNTFTVPTGQGGLYSINSGIVVTAYTAQTVPSVALEIEVTSNGSALTYYGVAAASGLYQGNGTDSNTIGSATAGAPYSYSRGNANVVVPLRAGDAVKVYYRPSTQSTNSSQTISFSTDGSSYLSIVKLN